MNKPLLALKLMVLAWLCVANLQATIRYVKPGSASTAWQTQTNVYSDLHAALTAAVYGDEIWVTAGIYKPTTTTDRTASFNLKNGVSLYGGFAGTETLRTQRNWVVNPTILSGDIGTVGVYTDNSYNVVVCLGTAAAPISANTLFDGFIVEQGNGFYGAGMKLSYAYIGIGNTIFRNNTVTSDGGAVYGEKCDITFGNVIFANNYSQWNSGAVDITALSTTNPCSFYRCVFYNNVTTTGYGALYTNTNATKAVNCIDFNSGMANASKENCYSYWLTSSPADPLFVNPGEYDFRLLSQSPCIDKGKITSAPSWITTDFYGNPLKVGASYDIGVAEGPVYIPETTEPANNTILVASVTQANLKWDWAVANPNSFDGYEIEVKTNNGTSQFYNSVAKEYLLTGLAAASFIQWRVRAKESGFMKNWSKWSSFSVPHASPIFVKKGATGNGTSWSNAMGDLETAIGYAVVGDEIWVASGTYTPTTTTDRSISINLKSGVALYGGFIGTESKLTDRNWRQNPTLLSGNIGNASLATDNSYNVVKSIGTFELPQSELTRLDGFIVEQGYGTKGAGLYLDNSNIRVVNTVFRNNTSSGAGGALYAVTSNAIIANTIFTNNKAGDDGGAADTQASVTFTHCLFTNNKSGAYAGAVYSTRTSTLVNNSIAWGNQAVQGGTQFNTMTASNNCIEGYVYGAVNTVTQEPLWVDAANNDFRLTASSPCIDKGLASGTPEWLTTDFYGNPRLANGNPDIGVFEGGVVIPRVLQPANRTIVPGTQSSVTLKWDWPDNIPTGITGYEIEIKINNGTSTFVSTSTTTYQIANLAKGTEYQWRVTGIDGTTNKNWTAWSSFSNPRTTPIRVKTGGSGDGSTWALAFGDLQSAFSAAVTGDTIWVAAGIYKPSTTNRAASFTTTKGIAVYGGFSGSESALSQRNWVSNTTVLSGEIGNTTYQTDNISNIMTMKGTKDVPIDSTARIDGFIFEKGYGTNGAGLVLENASPTVINCIFRNNQVDNNGGAVYGYQSKSKFFNTVFVNNKASQNGGGIYSNLGMSFEHCVFYNNTSGNYGDNLMSFYKSKVTNSIAWSEVSGSGFYNVDYSYCCSKNVTETKGIINADPQFVDAANGDFRVYTTSPCIDKGLNSATTAWIKTDFYGNARLAGTNVDMGIVEGGVEVPQLKTPLNKTILAGTTTSMSLVWAWASTQPSGITGYEVELQINGGGSQLLTTTNMTYTLSGIAQGSTYKWRVRGIDGTTYKNWSQWAMFSVKHTTPLYVKPGGTGDGLSWATALGSLQEALSKAIYSDEIWVAAGTYKPTSGTDRSISFNMKNGVAIYGGFAGTETELAQRNWAANPTILSGDIGVTGTDTDNTNIVVKAIGTNDAPLDSTSRLDGLIIEKGYATYVYNDAGAGLRIYYASPKVVNSIFRNNYADRDGGAVYAYFSNSVFANTLFVSNKTNSSGGAVFSGGNLTFTHCTFVNNRAESSIAAIYGNAAAQTITNCIVWGNTAQDGAQQLNSVTCTYSCIEGGYDGTGNISSTPLFIDATNGNFRLQQESPCINKALANSNPAWLTTDLDRLPRMISGYSDMGAYEAAYAVSMSPGNNQAHAQTAYMGSMIKWDIAPAVSNVEKQQVTCYYELWKNGVPTTIIAQGQSKGKAEVNINPLDFNASYQWRVGVKTAGYTYWSTPATFYIGRENPIYVKTNGAGDGSSWANALGSVSSALELANPGDRIWVAAGTYKPSGTGRDAAFKLKPYVELLGGFVEDDNWGTGRNPEKNITILSGDLGTPNDDSDNAYHVINNSYSVGTPLIGAAIDGFTITGGNAGSTNGGGMLNTYANPTVRYCKFIGNKAASGGAIANTSSSPSIVNSLLVKNMATANGGAIYSDVTSMPTIINSTIANNSATTGGGISGKGTVGNTIVYDNTGGQIEGTPTVNYSCVQGGFTGTDNVTASPRFKDAANGNFAIGPFSSCFDKGNSDLITTDFSTFDLSFSEMRNFVSSVDIGAYELKYPDIAARVEVTQATPANAASGIDKSAPIVLTFNEPVTIYDQLGVTMASGIAFKSMSLSDDKKTLTLVPSKYWPFNSAQKLLIANGAIRFADNTNFRMLDYESGFGIRACLPVTVAIDLLKPTTCPGTLATMTAKTTGDVLDYEWQFKQSVVASGTPSFSIQKLTADSTGVYYCNVTDMCGNVASAQSEVKFTEGILKPVIVKKWNDVYLVDNSSKRFSDYQWYANDVEKESGSQYITVSNPWVGQSLYVTVLDNNTGCQSTSDKTTISLIAKSVSVYPNPVVSNQSVEIQLPTVATNTRVRLFDASGNLKAEEGIRGVDHYLFDKTNFAPGVYIMEIVEAEEKTIVKLIIQ